MKKITALILTFVIVSVACSSALAKVEFSDVPAGHWAQKYVSMIAEKGIIQGIGNNKFNPNGLLTYGEAIKLAAKINADYYGNTIVPTQGNYHWATSYVNYAVKNNIVSNVKALKLNEPIKREKMFEYFYKCLPMTEFPVVNEKRSGYNDITPYAMFLYEAGIVLGNGQGFMPETNITRAEAATIICRIIDKSLRVTSPNTEIEYIQEPAKKLLDVVNQARRKIGVDTLTIDDQLTKAACMHHMDIDNNRWSNGGATIREVSDVMAVWGVKYTYLEKFNGVTTCMEIDEVINSFITTPELYQAVTDPKFKKMAFMSTGHTVFIGPDGELSWLLVLTD